MLCGARSGSGGVNAKYHTKVRNFSEYDKFLLSAHIIIINNTSVIFLRLREAECLIR